MSDEIERIRDIIRLTEYVPHLLALYNSSKYRKLFEEDMTQTRFVSRLFEHFNNPKNFLFGRIVNHRLEFFLCTGSPYEDPKKQLVWFAYSNPKNSDKTYKWLDWCKEQAVKAGLEELRFISNRNTKAYRLFAKKVGASLMSQTFTINLKDK